jgi:nitroreductase
MTDVNGSAGLHDPRAEIDQLMEAALAALHAPSILNSQPWRWRARGCDVELRLDPERRLAGVDPTGRLQLVSCGVALHHALTALAAAGFAGDVVRLPGDGPTDVVARLRRGPAVAPDRSTYEAIYTRRTDRRPFADTPPTPADLNALRAAALRHGVRLQVLDHDQVEQFAGIVVTAAAAEHRVPAYERDVAAWSGRPRASGDGVAVNDMTTAGNHRVPPRNLALDREPGLPAGTGTDRGTVYTVLVVEGQQRSDWLAAGEAMSDVWLTLTARGLAASPISEVVEVPQANAALRRLLGWTGHPAVALRIGRPAQPLPPPRSARRSGIDVIGLPGDPVT